MIIDAVQRAAALTPMRRRGVGQAAREHLLKRNAFFRETALRLVEQ
jgi:hypothetical protein